MSNEMTSQNQITEGGILRPLLAFFFPILLGTFFQQLYNTADAVVVGNYVGTVALAAVGAPPVSSSACSSTCLWAWLPAPQ